MSGTIFFGHDHLYSPVVMFNNAGIVLERYEYDAYGKVRIMNANYVNLNYSLLGNTYFFTGRELDTLDAGNCTLMYYRARYYTPTTGRFLQRDPLGIDPAGKVTNIFVPVYQYVYGMDLYEYVLSCPTRYTDASGLECGECLPPAPGMPNVYDAQIAEIALTGSRFNPGLMDRLDISVDLLGALGSLGGATGPVCGLLSGNLTAEQIATLIARP